MWANPNRPPGKSSAALAGRPDPRAARSRERPPGSARDGAAAPRRSLTIVPATCTSLSQTPRPERPHPTTAIPIVPASAGLLEPSGRAVQRGLDVGRDGGRVERLPGREAVDHVLHPALELGRAQRPQV